MVLGESNETLKYICGRFLRATCLDPRRFLPADAGDEMIADFPKPSQPILIWDQMFQAYLDKAYETLSSPPQ